MYSYQYQYPPLEPGFKVRIIDLLPSTKFQQYLKNSCCDLHIWTINKKRTVWIRHTKRSGSNTVPCFSSQTFFNKMLDIFRQTIFSQFNSWNSATPASFYPFLTFSRFSTTYQSSISGFENIYNFWNINGSAGRPKPQRPKPLPWRSVHQDLK